MKLHRKSKVAQNQKRTLYGKSRKRVTKDKSGYHKRMLDFGSGLGEGWSTPTPFGSALTPFSNK